MTPAELQRQRDDEKHWQQHRPGLLAMIDTGTGTNDSDSDSDSDLFGAHIEAASQSAAPTPMEQVRVAVEQVVQEGATQRNREEAIACLQELRRKRSGDVVALVDLLCTVINSTHRC